MAATRRLSELTASVEERFDSPDGPLVVGLSGGADSAALAWICARLGRVRALHVNHGFAHSPLMEKAAGAIAHDLEVELEVVQVEVPPGASPEGQARNARYAAFAEATSSDEKLLTAHTRDDSVETVVLNLIRGTGPRGLAGIPWYRPPNIFRPLLRVSRSETRELAGLASLQFVDDPMNEDPGLARNVVRTKVLPVLSEMNPQVRGSIDRMASTILEDEMLLAREAADVPVLENDGLALAVGDLLAVPRPVADRAVKMVLGRVLGQERVSSERVRSVWAVVEGRAASAELAGGTTASRRGPFVVVADSLESLEYEPVTLTPGLHRSGRLEFEVMASDGVCKVAPLSRWSAIFPEGTVLETRSDGVVTANGRPAWTPGVRRYPVAWYEPGAVGYLSVVAREVEGWTSSH